MSSRTKMMTPMELQLGTCCNRKHEMLRFCKWLGLGVVFDMTNVKSPLIGGERTGRSLWLCFQNTTIPHLNEAVALQERIAKRLQRKHETLKYYRCLIHLAELTDNVTEAFCGKHNRYTCRCANTVLLGDDIAVL